MRNSAYFTASNLQLFRRAAAILDLRGPNSRFPGHPVKKVIFDTIIIDAYIGHFENHYFV